MALICGIYGYQITVSFEIHDLKFIPKSADNAEVKKWARNLDEYHLTAVLVGEDITAEFLFDLEAVLSFIEHLDVWVSQPIACESGDPFLALPKSIKSPHRRRSGGGAMILEDVFEKESRAACIRKLLSSLSDVVFCEQTQFRRMFFKYVESFRSPTRFVETTFFLVFTGLEAHARAVSNDFQTASPVKSIRKLFAQHGFSITAENWEEPARAVKTYVELRNSLFHNSQLSTTVRAHGATYGYKLTDYLPQLCDLVALVILKTVKFDDNHINWNSWLDRMPFK